MLWAAFITGLIGSLHCTGMCGPLICAMPLNKKNAITETGSLILYNSGRIISYAILGLLLGTGGSIISKIAGEWFAYLGGALLIVVGIYKLIFGKKQELKMPPFMRKWMGKLFRTKSVFALPVLGMLNGFIPCGAVYAALAGASVTGSPLWGACYMLVFGLATWPAIFSSYYVTGKLIKLLRGYYRPATAIFLCVLGVLLITRNLHEKNHQQANGEISVCK